MDKELFLLSLKWLDWVFTHTNDLKLKHCSMVDWLKWIQNAVQNHGVPGIMWLWISNWRTNIKGDWYIFLRGRRDRVSMCQDVPDWQCVRTFWDQRPNKALDIMVFCAFLCQDSQDIWPFPFGKKSFHWF